MKKRLNNLTLIIFLILSSTQLAFSEDSNEVFCIPEQSISAQVTLTVHSPIIHLTLPTRLPYYIDENDKAYVASTARITNDTKHNFFISSIKIESPDTKQLTLNNERIKTNEVWSIKNNRIVNGESVVSVNYSIQPEDTKTTGKLIDTKVEFVIGS